VGKWVPEPVVKAPAPVAQPAEPVAKPPEPVVKAADPVAKPPQPVAKPFEPVAPALAWTPPPRPAVVRLPKVTPPPACPRQPSAEESACTALDVKNAELRAQIAKLESRVNALQGAGARETPPVPEKAKDVKPAPPAAKVAPPVAASAAAPALFSAAASEPASASANAASIAAALAIASVPAGEPVVPAVHKTSAKLRFVQPKAAPQPAGGMPWGWIAGAGAAVFVLIGAVQLWRRRRRSSDKVMVPLQASDAVEEQVEPTLG
jgi:hypothetical protein